MTMETRPGKTKTASFFELNPKLGLHVTVAKNSLTAHKNFLITPINQVKVAPGDFLFVKSEPLADNCNVQVVSYKKKIGELPMIQESHLNSGKYMVYPFDTLPFGIKSYIKIIQFFLKNKDRKINTYE